MKKAKERIEEFWYINGDAFVVAVTIGTIGCVCKWLYHVLLNYFNGVLG